MDREARREYFKLLACPIHSFPILKCEPCFDKMIREHERQADALLAAEVEYGRLERLLRQAEAEHGEGGSQVYKGIIR